MHIQNCEINKYTIKKCLYLIVSKKTITFAGKKAPIRLDDMRLTCKILDEGDY